jgi:hypothetical protein
VIRPALAEARLMTEKYAHDAEYVAHVSGELRDIEEQILRSEEAMGLRPEGCLAGSSPCDQPADAGWIRAKSCELNLRLRRIEASSKLSDVPGLSKFRM